MRVKRVKEIVEEAGTTCGIGSYKPKYGRFRLTKFDEIDSYLNQINFDSTLEIWPLEQLNTMINYLVSFNIVFEKIGYVTLNNRVKTIKEELLNIIGIILSSLSDETTCKVIAGKLILLKTLSINIDIVREEADKSIFIFLKNLKEKCDFDKISTLGDNLCKNHFGHMIIEENDVFYQYSLSYINKIATRHSIEDVIKKIY